MDQRSAQPNLQAKSGTCTVVYKECQKNQALDTANHCVDGCGEFMRRGREGQEALQCMACGCHRSYHRSVLVGDNGKELDTIGEVDAVQPRLINNDLHLSLSRIETVALNLMEATGRALPLLAADHPPRGSDDLATKELDTVMKISIENLDHISKVTLSTVECIGILQTAASTQQSASSRDRPSVPDHGRLSSEVSPVMNKEHRRRAQLQLSPSHLHIQSNLLQVDRISAPNGQAQNGSHPGKPKRKRTQLTDEQREKMKSYAEHAGWTIVGQRKENIAAACKDIGVTPKTLKYWIHNAKQKLKRSHDQAL
ncbi:zinc-finger homeodomain protein 7 [Physcomitrium patens]